MPGVTPLRPDVPVFTAYLAGGAICRPPAQRASHFGLRVRCFLPSDGWSSIDPDAQVGQKVERGRGIGHSETRLVAGLVPGAALMQVARCTGRHMHAPPGQSASFGGAALCGTGV